MDATKCLYTCVTAACMLTETAVAGQIVSASLLVINTADDSGFTYLTATLPVTIPHTRNSSVNLVICTGTAFVYLYIIAYCL